MSWIDIPSGHPGTHYGANLNNGQGFKGFRIELYLGSADAAENDLLFEALKSVLDTEHPLDIHPEALEGKKVSRFAVYYPQPVSVAEQDTWPDVIEWAVENLGEFRDAFDPILSQTKTNDSSV